MDFAEIVGTVGGLLGGWAAYVTMYRDRPRLNVEIEHRYTSKAFIKADKFHDPADRTEPEEFALISARNVGNRPLRLEEIAVLFAEEKGPGTIAGHMPLDDVVLRDDRRRFTYALTLKWMNHRLIAAGFRDDLGKIHWKYAPASLRGNVNPRKALRRHQTTSAGIAQAGLQELEQERRSKA